MTLHRHPKALGQTEAWSGGASEQVAEAGRPVVRDRKGGAEPLVMVTAYDAPSARAVAAAGADIILVGDSLGMVVLGYDDTLQVTMEDMVSHTAAVARSDRRSWSSPTCPGPATTSGAQSGSERRSAGPRRRRRRQVGGGCEDASRC